MDRPAYATFQDGHAYIGDETNFVKVNINQTPYTVVGRGTSGESDRSEDIAAPFGNVVLIAGIMAGVPLGSWYPELSDCFLVAVTEKRTKQEIDRWANCLTHSTSAKEVAHA